MVQLSDWLQSYMVLDSRLNECPDIEDPMQKSFFLWWLKYPTVVTAVLVERRAELARAEESIEEEATAHFTRL